MKITLALLCVLTLSVDSHAQTLKKAGHSYLQFHDKVGLLVDTKIRALPGGDSDGLFEALLNAKTGSAKGMEKYDSVLVKIESSVTPLERAKTLFKDIYAQKGKEVTMLDVDYATLPDYPAQGKTAPKKDFRTLKDTYGIDAVVHITVDYGMEIYISYGITKWRRARCRVITDIVSTSGNQYIIHDVGLTSKEKIDDGWNNPPDYGSLKEAIRTAITESLLKQRELYGNL